MSGDRILLTGDVRDKFTELSLFDCAYFDRDGPIWTKEREAAPGFFDIAVLRSDPWETKPKNLLAFEAKLLPLGTDLLSRAANDEAAALAEVGRFMLYNAEDLPSALIYLKRAHERGAVGVVVDLAVVALFTAEYRRFVDCCLLHYPWRQTQAPPRSRDEHDSTAQPGGTVRGESDVNEQGRRALHVTKRGPLRPAARRLAMQYQTTDLKALSRACSVPRQSARSSCPLAKAQ